MYDENNPLTYEQLYFHKTIEDLDKKREELQNVQTNLKETQDTFSDKSMKELRNFVRTQKRELEQLFTQLPEKEIEDVHKKIETLKKSPIFLDITEQHEQIRFLKDSIHLQVEKYRRQKTEYKLLRKADISKTREDLQRVLPQQPNIITKFITLYGISRFITEDDIRTQFDRYGFIYDVILDSNGKQAIIEYDTPQAAQDSLKCESQICQQIVLGKLDDFESIGDDDESDTLSLSKSYMTHYADDLDTTVDDISNESDLTPFLRNLLKTDNESTLNDVNYGNYHDNDYDYDEYNEQSEDNDNDDDDDFNSRPSTIRRSSFSPNGLPSPISFQFDQI